MSTKAQLELEIASLKKELSQYKTQETITSSSPIQNVASLSAIMPGQFFVKDKNLRYVEANDVFLEAIGQSRESLIGSTISDVFADVPEMAQIYHQADLDLISSGKNQNYESQIILKDGTKKPVLIKKSIIYDAEGAFNGIVGLVIDLTMVKAQEKELHESQEQYKRLFSKSDEPNILLSAEGKWIDCNDATLVTFGLKKKRDFLVTEPLKYAPKYQPDGVLSSEKLQKQIQACIKKGYVSYEWQILHADETLHWVESVLTWMPYRESYIIHMSLRNIDAKKEVEELARKQARLIELFNSGDMVLFEWKNDDAWSVEFVSKSVKKVFGHSDKDFLSGDISYASCIHEEDIGQVIQEVTEAVEENLTNFVHDPYRIYTKTGEIRWVYDVTTLIRDESDTVIGFLGYIFDITNMKNSELELSLVKERLEYAVDANEAGLWDWNLETNEVYLSPQWKAMLGYKDSELSNSYESFEKNICPDDYEKAMEQIQEHFEHKRAQLDIMIRMYHKDGSMLWIHNKGRALFDHNGKPYRMLGFNHDNTKEYEQTKRLQLLEQAYDSNNDAIFLIDPKSAQFIDVNQRAIETYGYTKEVFLEMKVSDLHEEELDIEAWQEIENALEGNNQFEKRFMHKRKNGLTFPVQVKATFMHFEDEGYFLASARDISDEVRYEKAIKQQKKFLDDVLDGVSDGVVACDENGRIVYMNPMCYIFHAMEPNVEISQDVREYHLYNVNMNEALSYEMAPISIALREGLLEDYEFVIAAPNKKIRHLVANGKALYDEEGMKTGAVVSIHDMTSRKETLEILERARLEAELANRSKTQFLANMSHEIRTPMNAIIGFSELLEKSDMDSSQTQYLSSIRGASKTLLTLINDILDISKIEAGKLKLEYGPVSLKRTLSDIENMFSLQAEDKGLKLKCEYDEKLPEFLELDEIRIRQILMNLVGNAIKFTDSGEISIKIQMNKSIKKGTVGLVLSVKDSGIGIEKSKLESIFQVFEQQDGQSTRQYGGTGLGLSISKQLSLMMGGSLSVSSKKGVGSVFAVTLPEVLICHSSDVEVDKTAFEQVNYIFEKAKILVVDDLRSNRFLLGSVLEDSGLEILYAENGEKAVEIATKELPEVIIMDIRMPVMDGYEATKILKNQTQTKNIPIIAFTASVVFNDASSMYQKGFDAYLTKPLDADELMGTLSNYLRSTKNVISSEKELKLSNKGKTELKECLQTIKSTLSLDYQDVKNQSSFEAFEHWAKQLLQIAQNYDNNILVAYSNNLLYAIEVFDVERLHREIDRFDDMIEQLEKLMES